MIASVTEQQSQSLGAASGENNENSEKQSIEQNLNGSSNNQFIDDCDSTDLSKFKVCKPIIV